MKSKSPGGPSLDITLATKRRVSFSSRNRVKPFAADQDENTIWDNTYEEQADETESTRSSTDTLSNCQSKSRNQPEFEIWQNLDTTVKGEIEMEFTSCNSMMKNSCVNMEVSNYLLSKNPAKEETILNQSVMDFTLIPPALEKSVIQNNYITMNQSSTMEFTCQQSDCIQDNAMQSTMDMTKGISDFFKYRNNKSLTEIPNHRKINQDETVYNTVTMDLTRIVPPVSAPDLVVPKINPPIFKDPVFNESATMDFTKTVPTDQLEPLLAPSKIIPENNCQMNVVSYVQKSENNIVGRLNDEEIVYRDKIPCMPDISALENAVLVKPYFYEEPDGQLNKPKKGILKGVSESAADLSKAPSSDKMDIHMPLCKLNLTAVHNTVFDITIPSVKHSFYEESGSQLCKPRKGILKTVPEPATDPSKVEMLSHKIDKSVCVSENISLKRLESSYANKNISGTLSDEISHCQEPDSRLFHITPCDMTVPNNKLCFHEEPRSQLCKAEDTLVQKTIPESASDTSKTRESSCMIDRSGCISDNVSMKGQFSQSQSLSDNLGTTYTIAKKQSLGKTYVVESNILPDKENIHPLQSVEINSIEKIRQVIAPSTDKENINPLHILAAKVDDTENIKPIMVDDEVIAAVDKGNIKPLVMADKIQHESIAVVDKENINRPGVADERHHDIIEKINDKEHVIPLMCPLKNETELKSIPPISYGPNSKEEQQPECVIQVTYDEPPCKKVHIMKEDISSTEKDEYVFPTEGDSSGLLENDLSAEMLMPSQQLNEDNALNILYSEKIQPPELSSPGTSAMLMSTTSFAYNNSELDTDQLIHTTFSQPDDSSPGEFSIHCQNVLKKLSNYLPSQRKSIDFDRKEHNERHANLVKSFYCISKEMHDILTDFKLPEFKWDSDMVEPEVSKPESETSTSIPTSPIIEEELEEAVVVKKTILEKVQEAAKRVKDGRWYFLGNNDSDYYFGALFKSIFIKVNVHPTSGIVNSFETDFNSAFDTANLEPIFHYNAIVLNFKLKKDYLTSVIGAKYDILTFLDYVHLSVDEVLEFNGQWVNLQCKYQKSHKIRMTKDYSVIVELLNAEHVIWWIISLKLSVSNVPGLCEDVTARAQLGEPVNEECLKKIARSITPGSHFLSKFMLKLSDFTKKLILRLNYEKEARDFK
ncbi:unnamed protein product [Acanthoscelides obtectus]|nr:unnamed protein product [Acanthoscelides obtectus]CAK1673603.1 hypothetical protein AOBTE_LOCUS29393 [Acanthoscelides obtectus]